MGDAPAPSGSERHCPACGSGAIAGVHGTTERMYGMGGSFHYNECARCGSLALADIPEDLGRYYPPDYYSLLMPPAERGQHPVQRLARRMSMTGVLSNTTVATVVAAGGRRAGRAVPAWTTLLAGLGLGFADAVLDVGCGDGHRLRTLRDHGFRNLTGSDPYLPATSSADGITLTPEPLDQLAGPFDVVMFHHSLEHVPDPPATLHAAAGLVSRDGSLIVRLPLVGCLAWRTYGVHWVQLDAPRHLFLPTPAGLHRLAERVGFRVARTVYDSDGFQFWGSELYRRGIPLHANADEPSPTPVFGPNELERFEDRAVQLNARGDGDQAAFLLRPMALTA